MSEKSDAAHHTGTISRYSNAMGRDTHPQPADPFDNDTRHHLRFCGTCPHLYPFAYVAAQDPPSHHLERTLADMNKPLDGPAMAGAFMGNHYFVPVSGKCSCGVGGLWNPRHLAEVLGDLLEDVAALGWNQAAGYVTTSLDETLEYEDGMRRANPYQGADDAA